MEWDHFLNLSLQRNGKAFPKNGLVKLFSSRAVCLLGVSEGWGQRVAPGAPESILSLELPSAPAGLWGWRVLEVTA